MTQKERRLNLLIYMSTTPWKREFGGGLEMWASKLRTDPNDVFSTITPHAPDGENPVTVVPPFFNQAVLFTTTDSSWHAIEEVVCPPGSERRGINLYYVSEPRATTLSRCKALFVARPNEISNPRKDALSVVQCQRKLVPEDWQSDED